MVRELVGTTRVSSDLEDKGSNSELDEVVEQEDRGR
jgi:hypothetical protein